MKQEQPTPTRRQAIKASLTTTGYAALKTAEYASLGAALGAVGVVGVGMYQQKRNFDLAQKLHQEMISAENDKYWQEYNETLGMHINHVAEYNPQLHQTEYFYDVVDTPIISVDAFEPTPYFAIPYPENGVIPVFGDSLEQGISFYREPRFRGEGTFVSFDDLPELTHSPVLGENSVIIDPFDGTIVGARGLTYSRESGGEFHFSEWRELRNSAGQLLNPQGEILPEGEKGYYTPDWTAQVIRQIQSASPSE